MMRTVKTQGLSTLQGRLEWHLVRLLIMKKIWLGPSAYYTGGKAIAHVGVGIYLSESRLKLISIARPRMMWHFVFF